MITSGISETPLLRGLKRLGPHQHLCLIYETDDERLASVIPFLKMGLDQGNQCVYLANDTAIEDVRRSFHAEGVDVESCFRSKALQVLYAPTVYVPDGPFVPDRMIQFLNRSAEACAAAGFTAFRAVGEMTWALDEGADLDRLIEYEAKLNTDFFLRQRALALCMYDARRFRPDVIRAMIKTHPLVVYGGLVCDNPFYVPPEEFLTPTRPPQVARLLDRLHEHQWMRDLACLNQERVDRYINALDDSAVVSLDPSGRIVEWNQGAMRLYGYQPDEILGRHYTSLAAGRAGEEDPIAGWQEEVLIEGRWRGDCRQVRKDGSDFFAQVTVFPSRVDSRTVGWTYTVHEITKLRQAEETLRQANAELEAKTRKLEEQVDELERWHRITMEREFRIKELRDELARLKGQKT
jgi:PAS domain S-box-containing protein